LLLKSRWLLAEGKRQEALDRATAAVKADPTSPTAHYMVGTIQTSLRQTKEAAVSFGEVLKLNPRASAAQVQLARLNLMAGDPRQAVEFAKEALSTAPNDPEARVSLVRGLLAQRDVVEAEKQIAALLKQYPKVSVVHSLDGTLRLMKKDVNGARASYDRALDLNPQSIEALTGVTRIDRTQSRGSTKGSPRRRAILPSCCWRPTFMRR
jgi:Tfp pilus assembly protein PilF